MANDALTKDFEIKNLQGMHARPACLLAKCAMAHVSDVKVTNLNSGTEADAKSVMSLLMLSACQGHILRIDVKGSDAGIVMDEIEKLFNGGFYDE